MLKIVLYFLIGFSTNEPPKLNYYRFDDYTKFRNQGDPLLRTCNYTNAIKKYKSCLIFKEKDEYSLTKIKNINDILNKTSIAANLVSTGKNSNALEIYREILILNPFDIESKKNILIVVSEAEKKKNKGDKEGAIQYLQEIVGLVGVEKATDLLAKIQQIKDKKSNSESVIVQENAEPDTIYAIPKTAAQFTGGLDAMKDFFAKNIQMPKGNGELVKGKVFIRFMVDKNGNLSRFYLVKGLIDACNKEALRIIKLMPAWIPAMENGENVNSWHILPIYFEIE